MEIDPLLSATEL